MAFENLSYRDAIQKVPKQTYADVLNFNSQNENMNSYNKNINNYLNSTPSQNN